MVGRKALHLGLLFGVLVGLSGVGSRDAGAICPSPKGRPGGAVPPGLRNPFDPPPPPAEEPTDPPPEPSDPAPTTPGPSGGPPTGPVTPGAPPPPTLPGSPTTPRTKPTRGLDAQDDASWELWWGLNRADVMPKVKRQDAKPDGNYARTLPVELRGAMDAMIEALSDDDDTVVQAAAGALASTVVSYRALDTLTALRKVTKGDDLFARDLAHVALGVRKDPELIESMRGVLKNKHEEVVSRGFAAIALIQLNEPKAMADVHAAVEDLSEGDLAGAVLMALGRTRDPVHLPVIREAVSRKGGSAQRLRRVRGDALIALGMMGDPSAASVLAPLLKDKEKLIARSAALGLGGLKGSTDAVKALREDGLTSEDTFVRAYSLLSLGRLGDPSGLPAVAKIAVEEEGLTLQPFAYLSIGLFKQSTSAAMLSTPLTEDPRTGRFNASALAAGLLGATDYRDRLVDALGDTRTSSAPGCSAVGLGLMPAKETLLLMRRRFWFDGARARPGHDIALAQLDPVAQSAWIKDELKRVKRSNAKSALVGALGMCGGPTEGATLTELFQSTPKGDASLRIALMNATSAIVNDRDISYPQSLLHHTYYLQPNIVLAHLAFLP